MPLPGSFIAVTMTWEGDACHVYMCRKTEIFIFQVNIGGDYLFLSVLITQ
jgi:hypothetical protein